MLKLTNLEASFLVSPIMHQLYSDPARQFPTETSFALADLVICIETRIDAYHKKFREIVTAHKGVIESSGRITYPDENSLMAAKAELEKINAITLEYPCDLIERTDEWPKLAVNEAKILKPILREKSCEK